MNNKIQSLESIVIGLYKEFNDIEETKKAIYLFIKNDIKDMATELYGTEKFHLRYSIVPLIVCVRFS